MMFSGLLYVVENGILRSERLTHAVLDRLRFPDRHRVPHQRRLLVPILLHLQVCLHHVHGSASDSVRTTALYRLSLVRR